MIEIFPAKIKGVFVFENIPYMDCRGAFSRLFCEKELLSILGQRHIVQINHSMTRAIGAIRGLHFQVPPYAEMKLVSCIRGCVWDVAVDLRQGSPTFLQYHSEELVPGKSKLIVIPEGFAHGFQVLEENSELLYLHTAFYEQSAEKALRYDDNTLSIDWPLPASDISERDRNHPLINKLFTGIKL